MTSRNQRGSPVLHTDVVNSSNPETLSTSQTHDSSTAPLSVQSFLPSITHPVRLYKLVDLFIFLTPPQYFFTMADDILAQVEIDFVGAGFQDLFAELDAAEEEEEGIFAPVPGGRVGLDAVADEMDEDEREELGRLSSLLPTGPPEKQKRLLRLMHDFTRLHQTGALGKGLYKGRERSHESFEGEHIRSERERGAKEFKHGSRSS